MRTRIAANQLKEFTMISRLVIFLAFLAVFAQAFAPVAFAPRTASTELFACRVNAKKEKIKRNRENMRKFKTGGRKGTSRKKILKKIQSSKARQFEAEFIAKCFSALPPPNSEDDKN